MTDSSRGWSTWLLASLCLLFQFVVQVQPSVMIPSLERDLAMGAEELGYLTSAYFLSYFICQIPSGWLLDRVGPRLVLAVSLILSAGGLIWFGMADSIGSAIAARVALGVFGAPAFPAAALVAARWFPSRRFTLMLGFTESFTFIGGVLVDLGLPSLVEWTGRVGSGVILGGIALVLGTLCWVLARDHPARHPDPISRTTKDRVDSDSPDRTLLGVFVDPRIWLAALHGGLFFSVIAAFGGLWAVPFLHLRLDIDTTQAAHALAILFVAGAIGAPLIGLAAARPRWRSTILMVSSFACAGAAFGVVYLPGGGFVILLMLVILGFFCGAYALNLAFVIDIVSERHRGFAMGMANLILGVVGGPLMLMLIANGISVSGADPSGSVLEATLSQMRYGLSWFAWGLALLVPAGVFLLLLLWFCNRRSRTDSCNSIH